MGLMRIPYTEPLPPPRIIPAAAEKLSVAIEAVAEFLSAPALPQFKDLPKLGSASPNSKVSSSNDSNALLLTGAGISTSSGLADYRGTKGTYTLNKTYRPVYYHEFLAKHEMRKRYWARSFLGWTNLDKAKPNISHYAARDLGQLGVIGSVITQNVDSFHPQAHPELHTTELHGYLRTATCTTCRREHPRKKFQETLAKLNPVWADFLKEMLASGALTTEDPEQRRAKGYKSNPDGDVDVGGVDYTTFRYPPCPVCHIRSQRERGQWKLPDGENVRISVDSDGAWAPGSNAGILKPSVIMFGESVPGPTRVDAEQSIENADRVLVIGSSLATYSAWRLIKRAKERGIPIGILNLGGVRKEESFFTDVPGGENAQASDNARAVRVAHNIDEVLPEVVRTLRGM